jgi:serine/threonine-protein kinase
VGERNFGKFEVVGFLGRGGMAEVFLCRLGGIGGFNKHVVVKRILPERLTDPGFLRMFLDEARLAANLNHPNIVSVFEIDEVEGHPYIAMEYVRGPTFATVIREALRAQQLHIGHMAKIMSGILEGLHHAHTAPGPNGEPLGLVHRDVSPQNILISPEGVPKILDFGVAKAHGRLANTEAGTLKGKLRYMAPEQLQQGPIDHRADVFSAGVCLCEATTGQNPFGAPHVSEVQLFKNIMNGNISKPSALVPRYPEALEKIVVWALEHDVNKRCKNAQDFHDALEAFVSAGTYASTTRSLAAWMHQLVPSRLFSVPSEEMPPRTTSTRHVPSSPSRPTNVTLGDQTKPMMARTTSVSAELSNRTGSRATAAPKRRGLKWGLALTGTAALAVAAVFVVPALRPPAAPPPAEVLPSPPPKPGFSPNDAARAYLDEAEKFSQSKRIGPALDMLAKARELKITDPNLNIRLIRFGDELETISTLRKAQTVLGGGDNKQAIELAKQVLDKDPDNTEAVQVIAAARRARAPQPAPTPAVAVAVRRPVKVQNGFFTLTSVPAGMVYLDDEPIGRTPIRKRSLAPGTYTVQVRAQGYRHYENQVKIGPGKDVVLNVALPADPALAKVGQPLAENKEKETPAPAPAPAPPPAPTPEPTRPKPVAVAAAFKPAPKPAATPSEQPALAPAPTPAPAPPPAPKPVATTMNESAVVSARPKAKIPAPHLPRMHEAKSADELARMCGAVEAETVSLAGVSPEFAKGITASLRGALGGRSAQIYPEAMYYFIVTEAARGRDKKTASLNLLTAHNSEGLRKLGDKLAELAARR